MKRNGEFVGVDEKFIPEEEKYVDESLLGDREESERKTQKIIKVIGRGYLAFLIIIFTIFIGMIILGVYNAIKFRNGFDNFGSKISTIDNQYYEQYQGTKFGTSISNVLDYVVTNNKTKEHIVTIIYKDNTATLEEDIVAIKDQLISNKDYEVSLGYDEEGRVNKITIKDKYIEESPSSFNLYIKNLQGTNSGHMASSYLDKIVTSNKTNDKHIINVIYKDKTYTIEDEIVSLKHTLDKWTDYECLLDYDENGYINKVTIKDI